MSDSTLVVVRASERNIDRLNVLRPAYEHHGLPILILTPEDAPISRYHGHKCLAGGDDTGDNPTSFERQQIHMLLAYEPGAEWYLIHSPDTVCLSAEIPAYLYSDKDCFYSNITAYAGSPIGISECGHSAIRPPYWMHRDILRQIIRQRRRHMRRDLASRRCLISDAIETLGVTRRNFKRGKSFPTSAPNLIQLGVQAASEGCDMFHSIKTREVFEKMMAARRRYDQHGGSSSPDAGNRVCAAADVAAQSRVCDDSFRSKYGLVNHVSRAL